MTWEAPPASDPRNPTRPVRVLYMEDDAGLARLFQKHLQRSGYEVDVAPDGSSGLALYDEGSYDVLAVDYKMPVRDGLEVIQQLAARGRVPPTIMLTANGDEALAVEALKLGASDYIVKDSGGGYIRLLPSVIEKLLDKHRLEAEKLRAQEELRQSEERLRQITESASDAIISFTPGGKILLWNRSAQTIFGFTAREALGSTVTALIPPRFQEVFRHQLESLVAGRAAPEILEMSMLGRGEHEIPVEVSFSCSRLGSEELVTIIARDITSRRRIQQAMEEAARLDATAILAGGVANQFNNLLFGVLGNVELLQLRLEDRPDAGGRLEIIRRQAEKASDLVQQLLAFARRGHYQPVVLNLNRSLRELIHSRPLELPQGVHVELELEPELWPIAADPTQITQVLMNLFGNAVEALGGRGEVRFISRNLAEPPPQSSSLPPGRYVSLTVQDDGCGMSEEVLEKIYTPFFSTKFQGRGLGMAAVWGIVQNHDGRLSVKSEVDRGTVVEVLLPALEPEAAAAAPARDRGNLPRGSETILLIDEEEVFRSVAEELLVLLGYRVLVASSGGEGLRLARRHPGEVHAALLDPHISPPGAALVYPQLVAARPRIRVLLCGADEQDRLTRTLLD
ncbi:MAG: response regulator, partial [Acidobacteria bacterium]|nr:response regulator [Acidobacteriota bacterium]